MPDVNEVICGLEYIKNAIRSEFVSEDDRHVIIAECEKYLNQSIMMLKEYKAKQDGSRSPCYDCQEFNCDFCRYKDWD